LPQGPWPTIAAFLVERFPAVPAADWQTRMASAQVMDERGELVTAQRAFQPGLRVYYYRSVACELRLAGPEHVVFQDEHLVVADKPHLLPVTPSGHHLQETLLVRLKRRLGLDTLVPVHRIDRETAGLVMFSVSPDHRGAYQRLFARRSVHKRYECLAPNRPDFDWPVSYSSRLVGDRHFMRMCEEPGEPNSQTRIALLEERGRWARYALEPLTGKRHQLRVHCAALGLPIAGDRIYPRLHPPASDPPGRPLQLVARSLRFTDPISGQERQFESAMELDWDSLPPSA
jgi:tRNA pseudouridine32 synthase/23S rRNA pseudouridine746 synthase